MAVAEHPSDADWHYLVGGLRISIGQNTTTPGPRSHIVNFVSALIENAQTVSVFVVSELPGLRRFSAVPEGGGSSTSPLRRLIGDLVRVGAALWAGAFLRHRYRKSRPTVIYERLAVMQSLTSFHPARKTATRIIESNGIMSRETALDRKALYLESLARRIEVHQYRAAHIIVAVSEQLAEEIVTFAGVSREKILVVPNGIPQALLEKPLAAREGFVVGFTGSVVDWQGLDLVLEAMSQLNTVVPVKLEVIGDGPALDGLREKAELLGLTQHVEFFGRLPQSEAFDRMRGWTAGYSGHRSSSSDSMYHSPLKLYEYAGLGMAAAATRSADALALRESGMNIQFFDNEDGLVEALRVLSLEARVDTGELDAIRLKVFAEHGWKARASGVIERVSKSRAQTAEQPVSDGLPEDRWASNFTRDLRSRLETESITSVTWLNHFTVQQDLRAGVPVSQFDLVGIDGTLLRRLSGMSGLPRTSADLVLPHVFAWDETLKIGLIGASTDSLARAVSAIKEIMPRPSNLVYARDGYQELPSAEDISAETGGLDILVVGLGAPLQDEYALRLAKSVAGPKMIITCGGWLDQIHGNDYYPPWAYRLKLNWVVRLKREPRRLWRRYTFDAISAIRNRRKISALLGLADGVAAASRAATNPKE